MACSVWRYIAANLMSWTMSRWLWFREEAPQFPFKLFSSTPITAPNSFLVVTPALSVLAFDSAFFCLRCLRSYKVWCRSVKRVVSLKSSSSPVAFRSSSFLQLEDQPKHHSSPPQDLLIQDLINCFIILSLSLKSHIPRIHLFDIFYKVIDSSYTVPPSTDAFFPARIVFLYFLPPQLTCSCYVSSFSFTYIHILWLAPLDSHHLFRIIRLGLYHIISYHIISSTTLFFPFSFFLAFIT